MTKQKVVVKVTMKNNKKMRKAMEIAATFCGVESVKFLGTDTEQIEVEGEGIDSAKLTCLLRKNVGHAELVSVGPIKEEKAEAPKETKATEPRFECVCQRPYYGQLPYQVVHEVPYNACKIL